MKKVADAGKDRQVVHAKQHACTLKLPRNEIWQRREKTE